MRILFCNYEYPPLGGGGGVLNALLAQELAKQHEVTVLTSRAPGLQSESWEHGVQVVRVPVVFRRQDAVANLRSMFAFMVLGTRTGKRLTQKQPYDVVNTHFVLPSGPVGHAVARAARLPHVLSVHGGDLYDPSKFISPHRHFMLRTWVRWLLRRSDIVVGQSRNTLDNMRHFYASEIEGVRIPLGIQRPSVGVGCRGHYGCAADEFLLVTVGRLIARKGLDQLLTVVAQLRHERARLLVIGTGPLETPLKAEARRKGIADHVQFLGHVDEAEKFRILRMSDLYVSTSRHEGFGLVFLEAMACRLPVVCYNNGGQTDFLEDRTTGYLLPLDDLNAFAARCRDLKADPTLRQRIGAENQRRAETLFIDRCADEYAKVFQEAITRCQMETLVSVSSAKKLPLGAVAGRLAAPSNQGSLAPISLR